MKAGLKDAFSSKGKKYFGQAEKLMTAIVSVVMALVVGLLAACSSDKARDVDLVIFAIADWRGQLEAVQSQSGEIGGAALLSAHWSNERAANANVITLSAGDAFGSSPPLASLNDEEPVVQAMNLMGVDADVLGNHEFNGGLVHLQRMIDLADFSFVAANLDVGVELTGVVPFVIEERGGVKVAIIGVVDPLTPSLIFPGNFAGLRVTDPVAGAMAAREEARRAGATVFVALAHLGMTPIEDASGRAEGPLIDLARQLGGFHLVIGGNIGFQHSETVDGRLVVQPSGRGTSYAKITLTVDSTSGELRHQRAELLVPSGEGVVADAAVESMLRPYRDQLVATLDRHIGTASAVFTRDGLEERSREAALGNLLADAMRSRYGVHISILNAGALRASLPSDAIGPADRNLRRPGADYQPGPPYDLVYGDVFSILPFANFAVTAAITGAQLHEALELSVSGMTEDGNGTHGRFLQVSGMRFTFDSRLPAGSRIVSVTLEDGTPLPADAREYTLALTDFLNAGGDGYEVLARVQGATREPLTEVLAEYIQALGEVSPVTDGRILNLATGR